MKDGIQAFMAAEPVVDVHEHHMPEGLLNRDVGLLKIRTYLEHRAHESVGGRTVVIEDRGLLALLFLNNNYLIVHHSHPDAPWYRMRALYFADPERYLDLNHHYRYRSYAEVIRRYLFRAKEPVAHPLWPHR